MHEMPFEQVTNSLKQPNIITMSEVSKSFSIGGDKQHILKSVNMILPEGTLSVIMGVSGSGKSTLLNILGGLDQADSGTISVCNQDLGSASQRQLTEFRRDNIGFIFQFHNLMPSLTVIENVLLGLEARGPLSYYDYDLAEHYLTAVGLIDKAQKLSGKLSGGEQQRVAIARALAKQPRLILADEPTGNLDERNGERIVQLLRQIQSEHGMTVCMVTHNPLLAQLCDIEFHLLNGNLTKKSKTSNVPRHSL